jgi:hypothetical protein
MSLRLLSLLLSVAPAASRDDALAVRVAEIESLVRERAPQSSFHVVIEAPFVVVGDESASMVKKRAVTTVRWSVGRLKAQYFARDPQETITIWLFKDAASYEAHARALFGDEPDTPYGYYSRDHAALIMNIATGGGTLVHELVHPFLAANFPDCPAYFDEGLASLYEAADERDGQIVGLPNWRLPALAQAVRDKHLTTIDKLMRLDSDAFYNDPEGLHYAQARYLFYYLQEAGLLSRFYALAHAHRQQDPTGLGALRAVLGKESLGQFEREWRTFITRVCDERRCLGRGHN